MTASGGCGRDRGREWRGRGLAADPGLSAGQDVDRVDREATAVQVALGESLTRLGLNVTPVSGS